MAKANSTIWMARSTPAQKPRGAASKMWSGGRLFEVSTTRFSCIALKALSHQLRMNTVTELSVLSARWYTSNRIVSGYPPTASGSRSGLCPSARSSIMRTGTQ